MLHLENHAKFSIMEAKYKQHRYQKGEGRELSWTNSIVLSFYSRIPLKKKKMSSVTLFHVPTRNIDEPQVLTPYFKHGQQKRGCMSCS